jgi:hypothetical protein
MSKGLIHRFFATLPDEAAHDKEYLKEWSTAQRTLSRVQRFRGSGVQGSGSDEQKKNNIIRRPASKFVRRAG